MNAGAATRADDFGADFRKAVAVFPRQPLLPVISVSLGTLLGLPTEEGVATDDLFSLVLSGVVVVLFAGWVGTEREWYRRALAGEDFSPSEILPTARRLFGRFFRLGLLVSPLVLVYLGLALWLTPGPVAELVLGSVLVIIVDIALTFVAPALAFATPSARRALRVGLAMLREHWPATAPYALTPAVVTILASDALIRPLVGPVGAVVFWSLATLVLLALKGAIVAFYLRHPPALSS
jgi:hypothetical protein